MMLVDASYGSDDEDDDVDEEGKVVQLAAAPSKAVVRSSSGGEDAHNAMDFVALSVSSSASSTIEGQSRKRGRVVPQSVSSPTDTAPQIRLPDVSELLGPSASDLATTSSTQKKRPAKGLGHALPLAKLPRGNLHPTRVPPNTTGGLFTPPQLRGRSNVATEDLDKIFSRKHRDDKKTTACESQRDD